MVFHDSQVSRLRLVPTRLALAPALQLTPRGRSSCYVHLDFPFVVYAASVTAHPSLEMDDKLERISSKHPICVPRFSHIPKRYRDLSWRQLKEQG